MKRFLSVISVLILIFSCFITVFSFNIDGTDTGTEWEGAQSILLLSDEESNSNISFGALKWIADDNSLYICFNFIDDKLEDNQAAVGVSFSVEDSEYFNIINGDNAFYDSETYRVEGAFSIDYTMGSICEIRVGFKHGIPSKINGKVRFIDSYGSYSNIYDFLIDNKTDYYYEDSYIKTEKETYKSDKTTKEITTKAEKTTKAKTTKTSKTTKKSDDNDFNLIDLLLRDETTQKSTPAKTTKKKTDKSTNKTKKSVVTSIQIIEKEIYVTDNTAAELSEGITTAVFEENNTNVNQSKISTSEGKKYQILVAVAGCIALIAVAVLGTLGANKKSEITSPAKTETDSNEPKHNNSDTEDKNEDS